MLGQVLKFIHRNGKIIPIRAATGAVRASAAGAIKHQTRPLDKVADHLKKTKSIKPNFLLKYGSEALSVGEGAISAIGLGAGAKGFAASTAASVGLEAGTIGMAAAAYAGKGNARARAHAIAKQELTNQALGWGTFAAVSVGKASTRKGTVNNAAKILKVAKKALGIAEEVE